MSYTPPIVPRNGEVRFGTMANVAVLSAINRYPVKACRGHGVPHATVEPWGLAGDRRWLVVDEHGDLLTAREYPRLLLTTPMLRADGGLDITHPDLAGSVSVPIPTVGMPVPIRVWKSELTALPATASAAVWFSELLGLPARLVYLDDPTRRRPNPRFARATDYVSFADGYPLLLTTTASLHALNAWIADGSLADEGPVPMTRFRPSVVVSGTTAWEEDGWRRVRVGEAVFRVVKGCDRCTVTLTDPDTAARSKEPIATLARHRRWDGEVWFGMNLIPDTPGAGISVGDAVDVLEAVPAPDGPPR